MGIFSTIYNDDLNAKSLPTLIGFGMKRSVIIISKIIINVVITLLMFFAAFIVFYLIFYVIGLKIDNNMTDVLNLAFDCLLRLFAYSSIATVVVYGTQKATMAMVTFVLLVTMFVDQILVTFLNDTLAEMFTVILIVGNLTSNLSVMVVIGYLVYVVVFVVLSILAFRKKELEF